MMITARAAITPGIDQPLVIETVQLRAPGVGEVLVEMKASGLCHTDLSIIEGKFPHPLPAILGHEGSGVVTAVGPDSAHAVQVGDHVIINNLPHCGHCRPCQIPDTNYCDDMKLLGAVPSPFTWKGETLRAVAGIGTFSSHAIVPVSKLTVIPRDIPFESACLVPCGVITGVGAVLFNAKVRPGSSVIIYGMGSIGLNVVQAARLAGATRIIAVDTNDNKEAVARQFGATEFINPKRLDQPLTEYVLGLLGGLVDYAFECVGSPALIAQALALTNPYWGVCLAVGIPPIDGSLELPASSFYVGRSLRGTLLGNGNPVTDIPRILDWYGEGKLLLDELVTHRLPLEQINEGFEIMKRSEAIRSVVSF